jgi:hypothetical protein
MKPRPTVLVALAAGATGIVTAVLLPAAASASAPAASAPPASAPAPQKATQQVLTLTARYADGSFHFVGKDEEHPQIGDEFLDDGPVRQNGKVVGRFADICTIIEGTTEATLVNQCVGTLRLAQGQIVTTGASGSGNDTTDAITGGTGAFAHVRGTVESVSGPSTVTLTYRYLSAD